MTIHRDAVANSKLFQEFDNLAGFEDVSKPDIDILKAIVLDVAEKIGPHLKWIEYTFKQYTSHDIQHLLNIADHIHSFVPRRPLSGSDIVALNAVELTFLWLAILLHDVGMFVSDVDEKQALIDSSDYRDFLRHHRERVEAAEKAEKAGHTEMAVAVRNALFAEFIRRQHAERVHAYIDKYLKGKLTFREIDLSREVGNLCESHNWGVRESRDSRHPEKCVMKLEREDGVGKTRVNLPYLACCLRLGDILDFDRSRTPLSAFHAIHFTEDISVHEWNKHLSVKRIEVTEHRAHYVAKCKTPADYVAVHHFLDWVDRELQECTRLVHEFPAKDSERYRLNLAPIVDRYQIQMENPRYVAGGFRFQLEYDQIMRLLMDKSLYPDETLFLRELLQNALDACRYQKARAQEQGMADKYIPRIQVWDGLMLPRDPAKPDEGPRIIFQDNGVGMSLDQVENFFMRVGKSYYRSAEFQAERERLAEKDIHLDACSQFGIGFLSCFLGGDRIEVETYRYGSEPLKITIEGPGKYFVIERLKVPPDAAIPFNSPADQAQDHPPRCAGTKVTVHLRDGWHKCTSESAAELVYQTLDAVAVNQEIPVMVTELKSGQHCVVAASRWDHAPPGFCGWHASHTKLDELRMAPSTFTLATFGNSIRGQGAIWFLSDGGNPVPRKGDLLIKYYYRVGGIVEDTFVSAVRSLFRSFAGTSAAVTRELTKALDGLRTNSCDYSAISALLASQHQRENDDLPNDVEISEISHGDVDWVIEAAKSLPKMSLRDEFDWTVNPKEVDALGAGDRNRLATIWREDGVSRKIACGLSARYQFALFGIESPGGFQTWDAAKGKAHRHNWLPGGVSVNVDTYGSLAPQPTANRLFVPYERSHDVCAAVTRALLLHAIQLWKAHGDSDDWTNWFCRFLSVWERGEVALILEDPDVRRISKGLREASPAVLVDEFCVALGAMHSKFGRIIFTRYLSGQSPYLDPRQPLSREHIELAAAIAGVPPDQINKTVESLSEHMGWDITKGLGQ